MGFIANKLNQTTQPQNSSGGLFARAAAPQTNQVTSQSIISKLASGFGSGVNNFSEGAGKGILSTIKGLGQIGEKVGNTLLPKIAESPSQYSEQALQANKNQGGVMGKLLAKDNLAAQGTAQSLGKATEQIAEFFIPAGEVNAVEKILASGAKMNIAKLGSFLGKDLANILSKAASLGTKMAVRATEGGGVIALQSGGNPEEVKTGIKYGAAFPVIAAPLSGIIKKVGGLQGVKDRLAGALSGRGTAVIDEIKKNPKAAIEGLTGESIETLSKDARVLKEAAVAMKTEAGKEYNRVLNNLQEIYENEGKSFDKGTEINKITDLLENKFGIVKAGKIAELTGEAVEDAGKLDFESSRFIKPGDVGLINRALGAVKSFRDPLTPKTLEGLASKIDKLKSPSDTAKDINSVIHTITSSLRESVAKMGEEAGYTEGANLARNFAQAMDKLDNFSGLFRTTADDLRPTAVGETRGGAQEIILPETEKTKIIQDLSTLFSGNKDVDKDLLRKLFGGQEVLSREAGRTLATATEKASTKMGDLIREAVISPIISPKQIGMIVAKSALKKSEVPILIQAIKKLPEAARRTFLEIISREDINL